MDSSRQTASRPDGDVRVWQTMRPPVRSMRRAPILDRCRIDVRSLMRWACCVFVAGSTMSVDRAAAQIYDSLDTHPPRWFLGSSDCQARVISQGHLADGGVNGGACETLTLEAGNGTEAILVYPIEPALPLDDLTANVSVMSARSGASIGFRIRFPYLRDPETRRPVSVHVYGASNDSPGEFVSIGIGLIERQLQMKRVALRREHGRDAEVDEAFVDGVIINAYSGAGKTTLRLDELRVDGIVPVGDGIATANARVTDREAIRDGSVRSLRPDRGLPIDSQRAFPSGRVTRILQHNGEPLVWVRSIGFDAVLLSQPPDADILSEAMRSRVAIYAPPPSAPDPAIESMLEPIAGWYLGYGDALDNGDIESTAATSARIRAWPRRWLRPLIGAPSESWRHYAPLLDAMIDDLPPRSRGVPTEAEVIQLADRMREVGDRVEPAVGVMSMNGSNLIRQTETIASRIGAPQPTSYRWQSMWAQAMRSLESTPGAILFRSTRPLTSGMPIDDHRAMALSYVNRMIAMISPWIASSSPAPPLPINGASYRCARLSNRDAEILILTSNAVRGTEVLAGDGDAAEIFLSTEDASKLAWRLTNFSAERLMPQTSATGTRLEIVSPDVVEIIVLSSNPLVGGRLSRAAGQFAMQASLDRWQLANASVESVAEDWMAAMAAQAANRATPDGLITAARRTLMEAESMYRIRNADATLRMARRADAWSLRCQWQLSESLMPDWPAPTSCPPIDAGATGVQVVWRPLMNPQGWGTNLLGSGSFDEPAMVHDGRWQFGQRLTRRARSELTHISRGTFQGPGALRARVTPVADERLPGGYAGTFVQITSPSVRVPEGTAFRIDAMVRTLGFGGPHHGLLVYDSTGGQEMGVLVRGRADWTPVRLYRQTDEESEVQVMFELIGAGEATIDDVRLSIWDPSTLDRRPTPRPIAKLESGESTRR